MIQFRLRELMAEKSRVSGQKVTYEDIRLATGISPNTLSRLAQPIPPKLIGVSVIDRLCKYFGCQVGDLLVYVPDEEAA
jgi:putative transcriptional regulator